MLARLRPLLDEFEAAVDSVNAFRDRPAGQRLGKQLPPVVYLVLARHFPPFLLDSTDSNTHVTCDVLLHIDNHRLTDLVGGRSDAGVRVGHRIARDMIAVRITNDLRMNVVASPDYLARHARPETPQDLEAHNCIRLRFPSGEFLPWRFSIEC